MALQDLTPQLRTRLNRMERIVGWFVSLATALLVFGFGYYIYHTADRKGWFKIKAPFYTYVQSASGLTVGDPVVMMGFPVGEITRIQAQGPGDAHNVLVEFEVVDNYFRYIRIIGSLVKVNSADFLGKRELEITRGTNGLGSYSVVVTQPVFSKSLDEAKKLATEDPEHWQLSQDILDGSSNVVFHAYDHVANIFSPANSELFARCAFESNSIYIYDNRERDEHHVAAAWSREKHRYEAFKPFTPNNYLQAMETPPLSDQLQAMVGQVQEALPNVLALTNKLNTVLDNTANATSNLNVTISGTQPVLSNLTEITAQLKEPGGPAVWIFGTNGNEQIQGSLTNMNSLLANTDTNLTALLINLAGISSNLNTQVQVNTNMLGGIAKTIEDTDDFIQGLKRHWLLRSAFKSKPTNAPPENSSAPALDLRPPKQR